MNSLPIIPSGQCRPNLSWIDGCALQRVEPWVALTPRKAVWAEPFHEASDASATRPGALDPREYTHGPDQRSESGSRPPPPWSGGRFRRRHFTHRRRPAPSGCSSGSRPILRRSSGIIPSFSRPPIFGGLGRRSIRSTHGSLRPRIGRIGFGEPLGCRLPRSSIHVGSGPQGRDHARHRACSDRTEQGAGGAARDGRGADAGWPKFRHAGEIAGDPSFSVHFDTGRRSGGAAVGRAPRKRCDFTFRNQSGSTDPHCFPRDCFARAGHRATRAPVHSPGGFIP